MSSELPGMSVDALLLARLQFAFTISFHIIFPALTDGRRSSAGREGEVAAKTWLVGPHLGR